MIKAYHQVGGDDRTPAERRAFLDQILDLGVIIPAIERVRRSEMHAECFGDAQGSQDVASFSGSPEARQALSIIAEEKLALLPEEGSTHTMFNCLDLIAGDFERVFLSIRDWYNFPSGFVFDAEGLIGAGAAYRPRDLLGRYREAVEEAMDHPYGSVKEARRVIERAIQGVRDAYESTGKEGITLLRADCAGEGCPGEIVWPGSLPLGPAVEMWREGRKVRMLKPVKGVR